MPKQVNQDTPQIEPRRRPKAPETDQILNQIKDSRTEERLSTRRVNIVWKVVSQWTKRLLDRYKIRNCKTENLAWQECLPYFTHKNQTTILMKNSKSMMKKELTTLHIKQKDRTKIKRKSTTDERLMVDGFVSKA